MNPQIGLVTLEGNEATGKTTLAKHLCTRYNAVYLHQSYRFKDQMFAYHTAVLRKAVALSATRLVVIDRLWMSEQYYGHVYRGGTKWTQEGRFMDRVLLKHGAVNVICTTSVEDAKRVVEEHPGRDLYQDRDKAGQIELLYEGREAVRPADYPFMPPQGHRPDRFDYDYRVNGNRLDWVCDSILELVAQRRASQWHHALKPEATNFGGHPATAKVIMVGDRLNQKNKKLEWPFFEYGNCSLYLADCLQKLNVHETQLCWINAFSDAYPHLDQCLIVGPGSPLHHNLPVIALGDKAYNECLKVCNDKSRVFPVRHPQWARRFDAQKRLYLKELSDAFSAAGVPCFSSSSPSSLSE